MLDTNIALSSAGSLSVAVIAFFFFIFQGWIYLKGPGFSWSKWGAALSLATIIYSVAVFIQFNSPANQINHFAELFQYTTFIILVHSVYGFTFAYLNIKPPRYHQLATLFHAILLAVLWTTKLVITDAFVYRSFMLLETPYVEPELGILGPFFLLYSALGAALGLTYWIKHECRRKIGAQEFIFGFLLWSVLGIHDALATLGIETIQFLMEYGFLGFSASIMSITLKKYMELFEIAENSKTVLEKVNYELEVRVNLRTNELEKTNAELLTEITQRKWANSALRESEQRFRTIFHTSPDAVNINRMNGEFVEINEGFTTLTGYLRPDVLGKSSKEIQIWAIVEDRKMVVSELNKYGYADNFESEFRCKTGEIKPGLISARIIDLNGENHILTITRDISRWKKVEEDKKKLEFKLLRAQKMEAIGTLAGGVAHDLNNILSGIVSYPDLLLMDLPEDSPLAGPLTTIQQSGFKAAAIVQDLLTLARRGVSISEVVNLNGIISEHLASPEFEKIKNFHPRLKVKTALETALLNISGSPVHLSKTVMNLVSNAAEAMPSGGTIFISTQNRYIDKPIEGYDEIEEGDYVLLKISDTGIGIRPEDKERIFEPFYTKKVMGRSGTGLGMAVVWGTVKDHKGYIDLKSTEGEGTTFTLYYPVTRESLQDDPSTAADFENNGHGETILIVDDVEEQRNIASLMLNKLGYAVNAVPSGEKAIDYMKNNTADLVVLDMIMDPGIDGLETYKKILEHRPRQKAIIASGFSETWRVKEAQRLGAGQYVKKPYTIEKIGQAVMAELGR
ncbi:sensory box histidine kinase/response regulator [Olavius sp. associated proteobacterium Delta 1]|nr:sensory box histidine kinase/response regulator [Olavius sp. associated proteobacterium Delta 1]